SYGAQSRPIHNHRPDPAAVKMMGDAFKQAPVSNPDLTTGIDVHFDLGNDYPASDADPYVIRGTSARGGESIDEATTTCTRADTDPQTMCQFSGHPGTVGFRTGFQAIKDAVIGTTDGSAIPTVLPGQDDPCDLPGNTCVKRFDRNRKDMFHYVFFAHAVGVPKDLCLNPDGSTNDACQLTPAFHTPRTNTGIADSPGAHALVTLGGFLDVNGKPIGTPFMQGSTLMHELGHTFELTHAGVPVLGPGYVPLEREPNCKPNYLSVMNYLFQLRGLFLDSADPLQLGVPHMDFSAEVLSAINEAGPVDGSI